MVWNIILGALFILAVADTLGFLVWYACSWPRSQVLGPALVSGPANGKRIALTFDDGPLPPYTGQVLDILQSRKIPATFFVCGKDVATHSDIVRRIHADGHTIGNHTWSHPYLYFMSREKIGQEIDRTQNAIQQATGHAAEIFRPPYGARWFGLYPVLRERGMHVVQWSLSGEDWRLKADDIAKAVCSGLRPGAVILLHDGRQEPGGYLRTLFRKSSETAKTDNRPAAHQHSAASASETVKALPAIVDAALEMGYDFVSVKDFLPGRQGAAHTAMSK